MSRVLLTLIATALIATGSAIACDDTSSLLAVTNIAATKRHEGHYLAALSCYREGSNTARLVATARPDVLDRFRKEYTDFLRILADQAEKRGQAKDRNAYQTEAQTISQQYLDWYRKSHAKVENLPVMVFYLGDSYTVLKDFGGLRRIYGRLGTVIPEGFGDQALEKWEGSLRIDIEHGQALADSELRPTLVTNHAWRKDWETYRATLLAIRTMKDKPASLLDHLEVANDVLAMP